MRNADQHLKERDGFIKYGASTQQGKINLTIENKTPYSKDSQKEPKELVGKHSLRKFPSGHL